MADQTETTVLKGTATPLFSLTDERTQRVVLMIHQWDDGTVTSISPSIPDEEDNDDE